MIRKNILSSITAIVILILSLTSQGTFNKLHIPPITFLDKIVHFIMYFALMSALIYENRLIMKKLRNYLILATIPFIFGAAIEMMQTLFTPNRTGSFLDLIFNMLGILSAIGFWLALKRLNFFRT